LILSSPLSEWVRQRAVAVFHRVAVAEGKIHGQPPESVSFHEVGAIDSIVDIVGACIAMEQLGRPRVRARAPVEGTGFVRCAHGRLPLPAPATLEILAARGIALSQCEEPGELVTPTGAALLAEFAENFGPIGGITVRRVGYGLGTRDNRTRPNVLRVLLGDDLEVSSTAAGHDWETDSVAVLETNLDDVTPEILGHFLERAMAAGALDVSYTPVQMKKNRPGTLLTVVSPAELADRLGALILTETTAFGVRQTTATRRKLRRELREVRTRYGLVTVKLGLLDRKVIQASPEYESCRQLATASNAPLRMVYDEAIRAAREEG
jgi:uncharacterized protein (TIGR00299 family) protein